MDYYHGRHWSIYGTFFRHSTNACTGRPKGCRHTECTNERMSCGVTVKHTIKMEDNFAKNDF